MKKKILSLLLTLCMLLGLFPYTVLGTAAYTTGEDGTIHLTNAADVLALMTDTSLWDKNIVLDTSVDLASADGQAPIGNSTTTFTGTFDGQGNTISGVKISGGAATGFFGKAVGATIKNLTVEGTVTATGNASGGLIGWGVVPLTIENCTNKINVTGTNRAGGLVGSMDLTGAATLTVTGCKNYGTVKGTGSEGHIGGLFGRLYKTVNNQTTVITDCANYGDITATVQMAGGLVGRYESATASTAGDTTITRFANYGTISSAAYAGGVFGIFTNNATSKTILSEFYNAGEVKGTSTKYVGGVCGYFRSYKSNVVSLSDCMNVGKIYAKGGVAGGIIGTGNGSSGVIAYTRLYNAGSVTAGSQSFVKPVAGAIYSSSVMTDSYYSSTDTYTSETNSYEVATQVTLASTVAENKTLFPALAASDVWTMTTTGPELAAYHEHADADKNGTCDKCELPMPDSCAHTSTHTVTTPATCVSTGLSKVICDNCETVLSETTLELDPTNHAGALTLSLVDGKIVYTCTCGATYTETTEPLHEIGVGANGVATLPSASVNTFADFATAMEYAALVSTAEQGVTVRIADNAAIKDTYTTPAFEGAITVTGGTLTHGGTSGYLRFILNGDMIFENLAYVGSPSSLIAAQNHKLILGEGITTSGDIYVVGGAQDTTVDGVLGADVTIRSGAYALVAGGNRHDFAIPASGTTRLTVGKTNAEDTLTITQLFPFSVNGGTLSATSKAVIRIDGEAVIDQFYANIYPNKTAYTDGTLYIVDLILTGDIQNADSTVPGGVNILYEKVAGSNSAVGVLNVYNMDVPGASDASAEDAAAFLDFTNDNMTVNLKLGAEYCVDYNGGHVDADEDGACDKCYASMQCDHTYYHTGTVIPSTCATAGSEEHICDDCGLSLGMFELPLDPNNHVGTDYVWHIGADGTYNYGCAGCGVVMGTQTELPVVYLDGVNGDDANDGLTNTTEVKTLEEAVKRLAETGGTVYFTARVNVTENITLPAYSRPITFTGMTDASGNANAGFVIQTKDAVLTLGGETIFDTFVFKGEGATNMIVAANWNDVSFGYVRVNKNATIGFYAGKYLDPADDTAEKTTTINLNAPVISGDCTSGHVFLKTIALGSWLGADGQTVSNKNVTLNVNNGALPNGTAVSATIGTMYTMTSTGDLNRRHCYTPNCTTTVNLNDETVVTTLRTGDRNVNGSATVTDATGYLDSLVINLNDNSTLGATAALRNVKSGTVVVSNASDGRTTPITKQIQFQAFGVFATDGTVGQVKATYGEHSFAASLAAPIIVLAGHEASYQLNTSIVPEHIWDDGVVTAEPTPAAPGVKTYTCTVCGATKTEEILFACTYHQWLPTDTGYTCAACNTTAETLSAPTAMRVESVTVENGTATVVLSLESSAPFSALRFRLHVPEGFTYASHVTTLGDVTEDVDPSTLTDLAFAYGTDAMAVIYIKGQDLASMPKTNFVTLTYTVADTFAAQTATVALEMVEAFNIDLNALDVDGVGYVWSAPAHTHEYVATVTKKATCGADGVRTYTCTCGDSYTEVIPATGEHTYTSEVTKEATCVEAGEMTHTCSVCGHSYTEPIPATGKHTYTSEVTKEATCVEAGEMTYTCSVCGHSYTEAIPATGEHTFGEWVETTPAQPGVAGEETRTCTVCGATETRATDPLPEVPETYAAYIGDVGYATVQAAMDAAKALDTIAVEADVVETVTPKTTVYLAGDYSGITISGDYTLDVTGRYMRSGDAIVEDTIVKYTPAAVMAIVRPNAVTENSAILSKQTLVLKSSVEYKIQARKATVDAYEAFYAVIDLCSADGSDITSPTADAKARRLIITDKVLEGSTYIYVADGIPASCMGNTIRVTFYGVNADGTVDYRTLSDNSIAAKLYEFGATGDAEMNLAAALLNYGAAAQTNFGYNTANLVNASLAAELQRSSLADYSDTVLNGTRTIDELVEGETAVFTATKITGELLDKIVLNIMLRPADTANKDYSDLTFVCEYTDYLGAVQTVVIPSSEWNTSGSMPIVKLDRLSAANLRQKLTINIYSGYGTEAQSRVLKTHYLDGFEYTATTGQALSNPEALRVLYYSIMHYSDMAKAYLAQ